MKRWCFIGSIYDAIGRILGYGLAPLSLTGFALPIYLHAPERTQKIVGYFYLVLCVLTVLCNAYLSCRKKYLGHGASMFPIVASLTAIPAYFLLRQHEGYWSVIVVFLILIFDLVGQPLLSNFLCKGFGLTRKLHIDPRCF